MALRVVYGRPPCYQLIVERIGVPVKGAIFTYGDAIYTVTKVHIDPGLMAHEEMHSEQQRGVGAAAWWDRYTSDPAFRLDQEVEAYRRQFALYRLHLSRRTNREILLRLSKDLSGPLYGRLVSRSEAQDLISR